MDKLNLNVILNRTIQENNIKNILKDFELNKTDLNIKRSIYIYGNPGIGKSQFAINILKEMNYDIIKYDAGDIRNTSVIDEITKHNMSDKNVMSMFNKQTKKLAIIMDEIDGMNNGDKGGINSLIKLIRPKKTKKQKMEDTTMTPIICIGNYHIDKKIKELMKVSNVFELQMPTNEEMYNIIEQLFNNNDELFKLKLNNYVQGDLKKLNNIFELYINNPSLFNNNILDNLFETKNANNDTKNAISKLSNNYYPFNKHCNIINDTDRTSVGLLWHENVLDVIINNTKNNNLNSLENINIYLNQLNNLCYADYIDRITFQRQIWQFNEMSSLIKTMYNHMLLHKQLKISNKLTPNDVRFTKILTKYSTEYNNSLFIQKLCQKLNMDKNDLYCFFYELNQKYTNDEHINILSQFEISKLDINRIYRYIDKYIKVNALGINDKDFDDELLEGIFDNDALIE